MSTFSVFGNPIQHSKSPQIYALFSKEIGISSIYTRVLASDQNFNYLIKRFFASGGLGANITMPFKEKAYFLCHNLTERACISGSVNTIKKQVNGTLLGDNTDGIGLITDLKRLNWLNATKNIKVLLLGAGGAARGVLVYLLHYGCQVFIFNRTVSRAQKLVDRCKHLGNVSYISFSHAKLDSYLSYDLIINATGSSIYNQIPELPEFLITSSVACYDMSYAEKNHTTSFIAWCQLNGSHLCSDGLGMLVAQAAHSFFLWHGILPSIESALQQLR